jgi:N-acyl homoserine lactone hydrolase
MRIHALQTGTVAIKRRQRAGTGPGPARVALTMADRRWTEPLPILAWLVEHPDGLILVDTGETAQAMQPGYFPAWNLYFRLGVREQVTPTQEAGPRIEALGFSPSDVREVVMTHLHTDHAGGLHRFPSSEILVSGRELKDATGRLAKVFGYLPHRWPSWLNPRAIEFGDGPFGPFDRSLALAEGVTLVPTPGHTPGHLSVVVRTGDQTLFLAGDTSYTQDLMLAGVADGVTNAPATNRDTLRRIRELARSEPTVYLPTHDPDSARRLDAMEPVGSAHAHPSR